MMKRKVCFIMIPLFVTLIFTGCGTTVVENTQNYFAQVGNVLDDLWKSGD